MPGSLPCAIDRRAVFGVSPGEGPRERVFPRRYRDEMHMVFHQTITQAFHAIPGGVLREKAEIETSVCIRIEHRLTIVSPLCHMMGNAGNHNARATGHTGKVPARRLTSQN